MEWEAVGAIAESVGALGVIISLLYLAREMHRNAKSTGMHAYQLLLDHISEISKILITNPKVSETLIRFKDPGYEPTDEENITIESIMLMAMRNYAHAYEMYREGTINKNQWNSLSVGMDNSISRGWTNRYLDSVLKGFSEDFKAYVYERQKIIAPNP